MLTFSQQEDKNGANVVVSSHWNLPVFTTDHHRGTLAATRTINQMTDSNGYIMNVNHISIYQFCIG